MKRIRLISLIFLTLSFLIKLEGADLTKSLQRPTAYEHIQNIAGRSQKTINAYCGMRQIWLDQLFSDMDPESKDSANDYHLLKRFNPSLSRPAHFQKRRAEQQVEDESVKRNQNLVELLSKEAATLDREERASAEVSQSRDNVDADDVELERSSDLTEEISVHRNDISPHTYDSVRWDDEEKLNTIRAVLGAEIDEKKKKIVFRDLCSLCENIDCSFNAKDGAFVLDKSDLFQLRCCVVAHHFKTDFHHVAALRKFSNETICAGKIAQKDSRFMKIYEGFKKLGLFFHREIDFNNKQFSTRITSGEESFALGVSFFDHQAALTNWNPRWYISQKAAVMGGYSIVDGIRCYFSRKKHISEIILDSKGLSFIQDKLSSLGIETTMVDGALNCKIRCFNEDCNNDAGVLKGSKGSVFGYKDIEKNLVFTNVNLHQLLAGLHQHYHASKNHVSDYPKNISMNERMKWVSNRIQPSTVDNYENPFEVLTERYLAEQGAQAE